MLSKLSKTTSPASNAPFSQDPPPSAQGGWGEEQPSLDPLRKTPSADLRAKVQEKAQSSLPLGRSFNLHAQGQRAQSRVQSAYKKLYEVTGVDPLASLLYCPSGAYAIAHALGGIYTDYARKSGRAHLLTTKNACGATLMQLEHLSTLGATYDLVPLQRNGQIDLEQLHRCITPRTQLLSLALVDPLTGVIADLKPIQALCQERGIFLHLDLTQAIDQLPQIANLSSLPADLWTIDSFCLGSLYGAGLLFTRPGLRLEPLIPAGAPLMSYQDLAPELLWDLALTLEETLEKASARSLKRTKLRRRFEKQLLESFAEKQLPLPIFPFGKEQLKERAPPCAGGHSLVLFPALHNELLAFYLARHGVTFSLGGGPLQQLHYLLREAHLPSSWHHSALAFRFDERLERGDSDRLAALIAEIAQKLYQGAFALTPPA